MSGTPHQQRNVWSIGNSCQKPRCHQCVASWKAKANRHSTNAARTKYALMCFLEGTAQETPAPGTGDNIQPIPLEEDPVFTGTEEEVKKQKRENELFFCGICQENQVKQGKRKPIIYGCGHTNCAECYNGMLASGRSMACPYCRKDITKAVRLYVE